MAKQVILDRDKLDDVLYEIGLVENKMSCLLLIIKALETHYEECDSLSEIYALTCCVDWQLSSARDELLIALGHYDELFFK